MSYYGKRAARDPAWHDQQLREAAAREARRRERDPERVRAIRCAASARHRARQRAHGLTFQELWLRVGGDREPLAWALRDGGPARARRLPRQHAPLRAERRAPG